MAQEGQNFACTAGLKGRGQVFARNVANGDLCIEVLRYISSVARAESICRNRPNQISGLGREEVKLLDRNGLPRRAVESLPL